MAYGGRRNAVARIERQRNLEPAATLEDTRLPLRSSRATLAILKGNGFLDYWPSSAADLLVKEMLEETLRVEASG